APVIDLTVGRVAGVRAVVDLPDGGAFAASAAGAGLARPLVEHLLRRARDGVRDLVLETYVDLAPELLTDVSLADGLAAILRDRVVLVAGAAALGTEGGPAMLDVLARLRVKGYGLGIDGFETGALARLPLTHVQLPSELIADAAASGDASALGPAVEAARVLGVPMIGACETSAEFDLLLQVGCSFAHGAFLAPSIPAEDLARVAEGWTAPPVASEGRG
ncbi:MAG: EAL domain-containing protein, partial [Solirubrobacteraceae bacterium]|nr:EAL domain-containing protein [Solirubrobacteraceae bacterium]